MFSFLDIVLKVFVFVFFLFRFGNRVRAFRTRALSTGETYPIARSARIEFSTAFIFVSRRRENEIDFRPCATALVRTRAWNIISGQRRAMYVAYAAPNAAITSLRSSAGNTASWLQRRRARGADFRTLIRAP